MEPNPDNKDVAPVPPTVAPQPEKKEPKAEEKDVKCPSCGKKYSFTCATSGHGPLCSHKDHTNPYKPCPKCGSTGHKLYRVQKEMNNKSLAFKYAVTKAMQENAARARKARRGSPSGSKRGSSSRSSRPAGPSESEAESSKRDSSSTGKSNLSIVGKPELTPSQGETWRGRLRSHNRDRPNEIKDKLPIREKPDSPSESWRERLRGRKTESPSEGKDKAKKSEGDGPSESKDKAAKSEGDSPSESWSERLRGRKRSRSLSEHPSSEPADKKPRSSSENPSRKPYESQSRSIDHFLRTVTPDAKGKEKFDSLFKNFDWRRSEKELRSITLAKSRERAVNPEKFRKRSRRIEDISRLTLGESSPAPAESSSQASSQTQQESKEPAGSQDNAGGRDAPEPMDIDRKTM